jgi:alpha-D-xyloside xylohydrolase
MPLADPGPTHSELESGTEENTTDAAYGRARQKEWDDQFFVGGSLLIAPLFAGETEREVYLPAGVWYGFETGERYEGGKAVKVAAGIERIPVFVREGAIIPTMPALSRSPKPGEQVPLDIIHFGEAPGEYWLYDDDGETLAFEKGDYVFRKLEVRRMEDGRLAGSITDERGNSSGTASTYGPFKWHLGRTSLPDTEAE